MQMRRLYQSTNRKVRAAKLRADALSLKIAGYLDIARVCAAEADIIDPPALETVADMKDRQYRDRKPRTEPRLGAAPRVATPKPLPSPLSNVSPVPAIPRPDPVQRAQRAANRRPGAGSVPLSHTRPSRPYHAAGARR